MDFNFNFNFELLFKIIDEIGADTLVELYNSTQKI